VGLKEPNKFIQKKISFTLTGRGPKQLTVAWEKKNMLRELASYPKRVISKKIKVGRQQLIAFFYNLFVVRQ